MKTILPYKEIAPTIDGSVFVADNAVVIGDVEIGADSSIWFGCTVRGDVSDIRIGARTNIQDNSVIHVSSRPHGTYIGDDVTVGHMALLHACIIEDGAFVGMQACIMDEAKVSAGAMVAAGSLVTPGRIIPPGQLWGGSPARYMRDLNESDIKHIAWSSRHYVALAADYK